jgi:tetratricopeptide (TPR) repeat protein
VKRLEELLEIGPEDSEKLKQVGVRTLRDLAQTQSLQELSDRTQIPVEQIQQLHEQAARRLRTSRYWRRVAVALVILILAGSAFGLGRQPAVGRAETRGEQLYNDRKYEEALKQFDIVIERDPSNESALANKGGALRRLGRPKEALSALDNALQLDSDDPWALRERADAFDDLGEYESADQDFDHIIQLDPQNQYAYQGIAFGLHRLGRYPEALEAIDKVIDLDPKGAWAHNEAASIYQANLGNYERAYQECRKAVDLEPKEIDYRMNLTEAALTAGHFQEASNLAGKLLGGDVGAGARQLDVSEQLSMRFITISALLLQRRMTEARTKLLEFVAYYKSVPPDFERNWDYTGDLHFIGDRSMDRASKSIILNLIQLMDNPPKSTIQNTEKLISALRVSSRTE